MKKSLKLITLFIVALATSLTGKATVSAVSHVPEKYKATTYEMTSKPLGLTQKINIKKTTDGVYVYCLDVTKNLPNDTITYTKTDASVTDMAVNYIIGKGANNKTDSEFFATQATLWIYLVDSGQMNDTKSGYVQKIKDAVYSSAYKNDPVAVNIRTTLEEIKTLSVKKTTLRVIASDVDFTLKNNKYVSDVIRVKSTHDEYEVTLKNEPDGTEINFVDGGFTLTIPKKNVSYGTTDIEIVVDQKINNYNTYVYTPSNSNYQNMLALYPDVLELSDDATVSITRKKVVTETPEDPEDPTTIVISKQDITTKEEVPGATLVIRNSDGKVVEKWVSTNKPHTFDELKPGKYTLEETIAPEGYILSKEVINFTVKEDGEIKKITMYNTPEEVEENIIAISKQDITTKEEVPGATLIIRDSKGIEKYRWVSGNEPYIIKGIQKGTYTLEEIIAPEGYILSNEKITFEVKDNGAVADPIIMFNTPEPTVVVVPPTGTFASTIGYILGGLVIIIGSVLIYKNVKKEQ